MLPASRSSASRSSDRARVSLLTLISTGLRGKYCSRYSICTKSEVVRLPFNHLHPRFPVPDEVVCWTAWEEEASTVPSALRCDIGAAQCSVLEGVLDGDATRDVRKWRPLAIRPSHHGFHCRPTSRAPSVARVHAALLDLVGRLVLSVTGDICDRGVWSH